MTVAVTGATGFLGRAVLSALQTRDLHVRALVRTASAAPDGVEVIRGDLSDRPALDALVQGADAVIHLAALMGAGTSAPSRPSTSTEPASCSQHPRPQGFHVSFW